jgi:hypothetical protein
MKYPYGVLKEIATHCKPLNEITNFKVSSSIAESDYLQLPSVL